MVGPSLGPTAISTISPTPNNFEAAVKFSHGGLTRYYVRLSTAYQSETADGSSALSGVRPRLVA